MKWPKCIEDLPTQPVYVIFEIRSLTYPDPYEDSRNAPNITENYPSLITFDSEHEWKTEIAKRMDTTRPFYQKKEFKAYKMLPAEIEMTINVEVKEWQN